MGRAEVAIMKLTGQNQVDRLFEVSSADRLILRELGRRAAEIGNDPGNRDRARLWNRLNCLESCRPLVYIWQRVANVPWGELDVNGELTLRTGTPFARELETELRQRLYRYTHLGDDSVFEPKLYCTYEIDVSAYGVEEQIGFVFQTFNLLPRSTALENVMLPLIYAGIGKARRLELAKQTLEEVKLSDRMAHRPNELSGGQRQRVAIARALVNHPAIILADEPTGNLDSKTSIEILGLLEEIHKMGNTVIIVTHEEDIAQHAHRIIRLMDGKIHVDEANKKIKTIADYHFNEEAQ